MSSKVTPAMQLTRSQVLSTTKFAVCTPLSLGFWLSVIFCQQWISQMLQEWLHLESPSPHKFTTFKNFFKKIKHSTPYLIYPKQIQKVWETVFWRKKFGAHGRIQQILVPILSFYVFTWAQNYARWYGVEKYLTMSLLKITCKNY